MPEVDASVRRVIRPDTWTAQPWKNGAGITHEIWRAPQHGDYDVRVSLAEVTQAGAFSQFPGYRRWSFLVGTAPIELVHEQEVHLVAAGDHLELPGEVAMMASLPAGPTHLLNVLARVPVIVGYGPVAHPVRFVFSLVPSAQLARWAAAVLDSRAAYDTTECVWIA